MSADILERVASLITIFYPVNWGLFKRAVGMARGVSGRYVFEYVYTIM